MTKYIGNTYLRQKIADESAEARSVCRACKVSPQLKAFVANCKHMSGARMRETELEWLHRVIRLRWLVGLKVRITDRFRRRALFDVFGFEGWAAPKVGRT